MTTETTASYRNALFDPRWELRRREILDRDAHKCRNCGKQHSLHVHHRQYHVHAVAGLRKEPWNYEARYLITLCSACHELGHKLYKIPVFNI